MILIILPLTLILLIFWIGCLINKRYRPLLILTIPIVVLFGIHLWYDTLLPVHWGLKRMPFIELVQIRDISASDSIDSPYYNINNNGVIEFVTDKKLDDYEVILEGSNISNLNYNDFMDRDTLAIFTSYDVAFIRKVNDKFLYKALFVTKQPNERKVNSNIYCKIFLIKMLAPVYETNEIVIPYNKLFRPSVPSDLQSDWTEDLGIDWK